MHDERDERRATFAELWRTPPGFVGALSAVNNTTLGVRYMLTALAFFAAGGVMALLLRLQLTAPQQELLGPQLYNELFTMHGSTMLFLFAVPFFEGLALYLLPLTIGSRDVAFPRLTAFSYWTFLFGGIVFFTSYLFGAVPDAGWFSYTPLSGPRFSGKELDFWLLGLSLVEVGGVTAGAEIVVTVLKLRATGMRISRLPVFVWALLAAAGMILFAFTMLLTATTLLELDRSLGTRFFDGSPGAGGSTLLWQHLFWFFGHPEVYIMFLPAAGVVSAIVPVSARRPIAGYELVVTAIVIMAFLSFGLWVHHMYTTGLPTLSMNFFAAASLMIALASTIQVFAWIATMWGRRPALRTPLLYVLGFLFTFVLGGLTGVMVAIVPFDWQVHDSYFIVAHFHYVLIGGVVFPILAGLHHWLPKFLGRRLDERLGRAGFVLVFVGFHVTFFPMHVMGLFGMPRRVYTYPEVLQVGGLNLVATIGAFVFAAGTLVVLLDVLRARRRGAPAGADPWGGDSLEWSVPSPPPAYAFGRLPYVAAREGLWADPATAPAPTTAQARALDALDHAPAEFRATLATDVLEAGPQSIHHLPGPTLLPLATASALTAAASAVLAEVYSIAAVAAVVTAGCLVRWLRPDLQLSARLRDSSVARAAGLPILTDGSRSIAWWGLLCYLAAAATAVGAVVYAYFFLRLFAEAWPQGGLGAPPFGLTLGAFAALVVASGSQALAARRLRHDGGTASTPTVRRAAFALLAGITFLALHTAAQLQLGFAPSVNAYASAFWVLQWVADAAVLVAIGASGILLHTIGTARALDLPHANLRLHVQITSLLWWFALVAALLTLGTSHAVPHFA